MARGRTAGKKNRSYPPRRLKDALAVAQALGDEASGMTVSRLTLAELLDSTPTSRVFKELVAASRFYGLTTGGINAEEFGLTSLGEHAAGDDAEERAAALKEAVMNVAPYKAFFDKFKTKKVPGNTPLREFLVRDAGVEPDQADECADNIIEDARTAGLVRKVKTAEWVDLAGAPADKAPDEHQDEVDVEDTDVVEETDAESIEDIDDDKSTPQPAKQARPNAIFVGHGKNKKPRDQLTKVLGQYGIPFKVAEDEPNRGRPIPIKVKETMEECGAAILIFSADEELFDKAGNAVWRPSENVVNELGVNHVRQPYHHLRESTVTLATNYESIGYISFEHDDLTAKANDLFRELIAFGILKVSVS